MATGSAARWAKSGCTKSSDERGRQRRRWNAAKVSYIEENSYQILLFYKKCILGTNTRVKGHQVH